MLESIKRPARWILVLVIVEVVLAAILYLMGDATTGPKFTFLLFVLVVNFPGLVLAAKLGLLGQDGWTSTGDPVLGWAVVVGVSLLFYSGCILAIHRAFTTRRNQPNPWKIVKGHSGGLGGDKAP